MQRLLIAILLTVTLVTWFIYVSAQDEISDKSTVKKEILLDEYR
ncbi:MAG: hypothetical protein OEY51_02080 [Cyclobacteriaceae bacterium]|nr:hypothetical protein [Cyclobacteriaceae bacterium]